MAQDGSYSSNPFLPFDPKMHVMDLPETDDHVVLFNKFSVVPNHLLVISREFQSQSDPILRSNFDAVLETMQAIALPEGSEMKWLAFYNAGKQAGASQPHRHMQLIPTNEIPLESVLPKLDEVPIDAYSDIEHVFMRPSKLGLSHFEAYLKAIEQLGNPQAYNLLFTQEWLLIISRQQESSHGKSMNSLAFAGCILIKTEEELHEWLGLVDGPLKGIKQLAVKRQV